METDQIYCMDCDAGMAEKVLPASVDLIFTDPPYVKDLYREAYTLLARHAARILKPGGFVITYAPQYHLPDVMSLLGSALDYHWIVCQRNQANANAVIYHRRVMAMWKPILIYQKPPFRPPPKPYCDMISGRRMKAHHPWEQSIHEALHLLSRFAEGGDLILDPFAGSGTTLLAAKLLGMQYLGFEIDENYHQIAVSRLQQEPLTLGGFA